jgi:quinol monooxygenase YgiN
MITLISKWKLLKGCPSQLLVALKQLAENAKSESGALIYFVNLQAPNPLDSQGEPLSPPPPPIPLDRQEEVVFIESYETVEALSQHLQSKAFIAFLESNLQYFCQDPNNPGFPLTETEFLDRKFSFISPDARSGD